MDSIVSRVVIQEMREEDVDQAVNLFRENDLPELKHGLRTYRRLEPEGCFVAVDPVTNEVISSIMVSTKFDPRTAYIGFYATKPPFQGKGIGIQCWHKMIHYLGPDRNVGLCSSPSQVSTYRDKAGFRVQDINSMVLHDSSDTICFDSLVKNVENVTIRRLERSDFSSVVAFDQTLVGLDRSKLLEPGLFEPDSIPMVAVNGSTVLGYGAIKPTNVNKPMIAPLYADSPDIASSLLFHLLQSQLHSLSNGLVMFILDTNQHAMHIAASIGLKPGYFCPRLWTKSPLTAHVSKIYALYSPDFHPF